MCPNGIETYSSVQIDDETFAFIYIKAVLTKNIRFLLQNITFSIPISDTNIREFHSRSAKLEYVFIFELLYLSDGKARDYFKVKKSKHCREF